MVTLVQFYSNYIVSTTTLNIDEKMYAESNTHNQESTAENKQHRIERGSVV